MVWHVTDRLGPRSAGYKNAHRVTWYLVGPEAPALSIDLVTETPRCCRWH